MAETNSDGSSPNKQTVYPEGGYDNFEDLNSKKPSAKVKYGIRERPDKEIEKIGGNDYDAEFLDEKTGKWHREREVFAISDGKKLYLNGRSFNLPIGFMEVIEEGYYLVFLCSTPSASRTNVSELGAVSVNQDIGRVRKKIYYCLDTSTGKAKMFNKLLLRQLLNNHSDLANRFESEPENTKIEVEMEYLRLLNAAIK